MDVQTIMSSLLSRRMANNQTGQYSSGPSTMSSTTSPESNLYSFSQQTQSANMNHFNQQQNRQQVRISPTITVIDAHFGLPTAAVAEVPMRSSATSVADFPPPSASLTSRSHLMGPKPETEYENSYFLGAQNNYESSGKSPNSSTCSSTVIVSRPMHYNNLSSNAHSNSFQSSSSSPTPPALDLAASVNYQNPQNNQSNTTSAFRSLTTNTSTTTSTNSFNDFLAFALNSLVPITTTSASSCDVMDSGLTDVDSTFNDGASSTSASYAFADGKGTLLCQVCSDRASGFHYGINSCEGCKGFFRRSIQQKIQYKLCSKSQQCAIVRVNRNRCQYCRFQKCLAVGMSRDAVRFGRVPKREKVKMAEEMQRASLRSQIDLLSVELEDQGALIHSIELGFAEFGAQLRRLLSGQQKFAQDDIQQNETLYFSLISAVVNFSKKVKGFNLLFKKDCMNLLKNSIFQILLIRWAYLKIDTLENGTSTEQFLEPSVILQYLLVTENEQNRNLQNSIIEFIQRFRLLGLEERQLSIFAALVLCQPSDSAAGALGTSTAHLHQAPLLKMLQQKLLICLNSVLFSHTPMDTLSVPLLSQSVFAAFADLRSLNAAHQDQLQATQWMLKNEPPRPVTPPKQASKLRSVTPKSCRNSTTSISNASQNSQSQNENFLATLAAVAASREYAIVNQKNSPYLNGTSTTMNSQQRITTETSPQSGLQKNPKKRTILEQTLDQSNLEESRRVAEMPTLKRALEQPPRNSMKQQNVVLNNPTTVSNLTPNQIPTNKQARFEDRQHLELIALLQQQQNHFIMQNPQIPPTTTSATAQLLASFQNVINQQTKLQEINQQQQFKVPALKKWEYFGGGKATTNFSQPTSYVKYEGVTDEDDEEPLNLCIRELK